MAYRALIDANSVVKYVYIEKENEDVRTYSWCNFTVESFPTPTEELLSMVSQVGYRVGLFKVENDAIVLRSAQEIQADIDALG